ncbi:MAG: exopolysaccharide biosynthesis polyprenyl glycosylphosphotransferase [Armatimonadetes bacterium]|nr:exopolysaccharide biosynthesis polyprenyl glycosylphosphotransferase [Armatimonadota bacterium]
MAAPTSRIQFAIENEAVATLEPRVIRYRKRKRILDILGSSLFLLVFFPLMLVIAILVKLTSPGPIFYVSRRVGLCGRIFPFYKFRSMYVDADKRKDALSDQNEKDGPIFKMKDDPRVTKVGKFLRKYSLDELPQFINVFVGDMSLVGPRPPLPREVNEYDSYAAERLSVRPGLTCYWQIMGRSDLSFDEWMRLDHKYMQEMNLWVDIKILLLTPFAILKGDGAY